MTENMNLAQLEFEKICADGEIAGPSGDDAIHDAEQTLDVIFPADYTEFLKKFGAALLSVGEIYGLPHSSEKEPPIWNNVVEVTKRLRKLGQEGTEDKAFFPFAEDGTGIYIFFNTRMSPATEIWAIGPGVRNLVPGTLHSLILALAERRTLF